eukprot:scaffold582_cov385-Prasinococcus_capsulatus_cf.AAC.50
MEPYRNVHSCGGGLAPMGTLIDSAPSNGAALRARGRYFEPLGLRPAFIRSGMRAGSATLPKDWWVQRPAQGRLPEQMVPMPMLASPGGRLTL